MILPQVRMVAQETAEAVAGSVRRGGAVWADGRCGFLDKHMFLRHTVPCNGLTRVFGCREIDEVASFEQDRLILKGGSQIKPHREVQRLIPFDTAEVLAECNGYPAAVRNHYGQGAAELWGPHLAGAPEADLSDFLPGFAEAYGVSPEIRIRRGQDVLASILCGENISLAVFTSLAEKPQDVTAELRMATGDILTPASAAWRENGLEFRIEPGETVAVLIKNGSGGKEKEEKI